VAKARGERFIEVLAAHGGSSDFIASVEIPAPTAGRILRVVREEGLLAELRPASGRRAAVLAFPELLNLAEGTEAF
jgi:hypothetical protein